MVGPCLINSISPIFLLYSASNTIPTFLSLSPHKPNRRRKNPLTTIRRALSRALSRLFTQQPPNSVRTCPTPPQPSGSFQRHSPPPAPAIPSRFPYTLPAPSAPCYNANVHIRLLFLILLSLPFSGQNTSQEGRAEPSPYRPATYELPQLQDGDLPQGDLRLLPREMELKNLPPLSESDKIRWVLRTTPFSPLN